MALVALLASREQRFALAFSGVLLSGVGFLPLFAGFSYEFSLASGLVAPSFCAIATAVETTARSPVPSKAFERGLFAGLLHAGLVFLIGLLHGLRVGFCDFFGELSSFALGPLSGILFAGAWGALVGVAASLAGNGLLPRLLAAGLALAGPVLGIAVSFLRYYQSPIIFAFDPFFGYFAGTLYDTRIDGLRRLLTYRAGTAGLLAFGFGLCAALVRTAEGRVVWRFRELLGPVLFGAAGGALSLAVTLGGEALGHRHSTAGIRDALGHVAVSERCEIVYASGILERDAHALARQCDAHIEALERYFDTTTKQRTTVYLFASARQKAALMGARNVYIAKPWRHEVYIQAQGYPHSVLGHELAHVVTGSFGRGPFLVAGPLGGIVPDPGRIEGFAEAASPRENQDLSAREWAKAMRDLELLPPLEGVFKLSFFGENASKAYTVAGAFVGWLKDTHGAEALRRWYSGETLKSITNKDLLALERDFVTALDAISVSGAAMEVARARFDRPAVFGRRCPHQVDEIRQRAGKRLARRDPVQARELYEQILDLDPGDFSGRVGLGNCSVKEGELDAAAATFESIVADEKLATLSRLHARERLADTRMMQGKIAEARTLYAEVASGVVDENAQRNLDVKRWIRPEMSPEDPARRAITALLIGDPVLGTDWAVAGSELGRWSALEPKLGLADYLLGRNAFNLGHWGQAAELLDEALERKLPLERVEREALRVRLIVACARGEKARAAEVYARYRKDPKLNRERHAAVRRFARRCGVDVH